VDKGEAILPALAAGLPTKPTGGTAPHAIKANSAGTPTTQRFIS
jgi:hypothetical protein